MTQKTLACPACGARIAVNLPLGRKPVICQTCGANANPNLNVQAPPRRVPVGLIVGAIGGVLLLVVAVLIAVMLMPASGLLRPGAEWVTFQGPDFEMQFPQQPGRVSMSDLLAGGEGAVVTVEGVRFSAQWAEIASPDDLDHNQTATRLSERLGSIESRSGTALGGMPATRVVIETGSYERAQALMAASGRRAYLIYASGYTPGQLQAVDRFLASFRLTGAAAGPTIDEADTPAEPAAPVEPLRITLKSEAADEAEFEVVAGARFEVEFAAQGGVPPYRVHVGGRAPRGLRSTVGAAGIRFAGNPDERGRHELRVHVEDSTGARASTPFVLTVAAVEVQAAWGERNFPDAWQGQTYSGTLALVSTPQPRSVQWSGNFEGLPPGLRFSGDVNGATLSGEPTQWGHFEFEIQVALEVQGADPVKLSTSVRLTVLPERPILAGHQIGNLLIIAHAGQFTEETEHTVRGQAVAAVERMLPGQKVNVWRIGPQGREALLPDDTPADPTDDLAQGRLGTMALRVAEGGSLAAGLRDAAQQPLTDVETIMILTPWSPENPGDDSVAVVAAQLHALAAQGRRVVLAMQSNRDMSGQSELPVGESFVYLRYLIE